MNFIEVHCFDDEKEKWTLINNLLKYPNNLIFYLSDPNVTHRDFLRDFQKSDYDLLEKFLEVHQVFHKSNVSYKFEDLEKFLDTTKNKLELLYGNETRGVFNKNKIITWYYDQFAFTVIEDDLYLYITLYKKEIEDSWLIKEIDFEKIKFSTIYK